MKSWAKIEWTTPPDIWIEGTRRWTRAIYTASVNAWNDRLPDIVSWMQQNAPWVDQSGEARRQLQAVLFPVLYDWITLAVIQGAPHGKFLELNYFGKYSILAPAIDYWGPILMDNIQAILR